MLIDCFTYFNEEDILNIRLNELANVVDWSVIVEATQTFTGEPKPLYFDALPSWIDDWKDRIVRVKVDFPSSTMTPWEREAFQRNEIMRGLTSVPEIAHVKQVPDDAYIIMSDADEIPRPSALLAVPEPVQLDVTQYFWKFNWEVPAHCNQGGRPVLARKADIDSPQALRAATLPRIHHAGWHFSFFGDASTAQHKIESFSHTEMNTPEFKSAAHIQHCIEEGIDPFDRFPLKYTEINNTFPKWVQNNRKELTHLLYSRSNDNAGTKS